MKEEPRVAVVGGGPAGLMAATVLSEAGLPVDIFDAKGSAGRKFLVAGRGGLNLTHSEQAEPFAARYGNNAETFKKLLAVFSPDDLRAWLHGLGVETFVGTSGRVFPKDATASDILKKWLEALDRRGVTFHYSHRWQGFSQTGNPLFLPEDGALREFPARAVLLALGGASWPQTGSDGSWTSHLAAKGIHLEPFRPANCGVEVAWSEHFRTRFSGKPLKNVLLRCGDRQATGDVVVTVHGLEGGPVYAVSGVLRDLLEQGNPVPIFLDLKRDLPLERLTDKLAHRHGKESLANFLRKAIHLTGPAFSLLREICSPEDLQNPGILARRIKHLAIPIVGTRPLAEAISSAGGVPFAEVNTDFMLRKLPGVFVAGEMLDWEAPTGGYLLQGAFTTGFQAARGLLRWLASRPQPPESSSQAS
ncbi:MAG: TIGR03862 family flavoprotein [Desulfurivibrionaceae bacterium]|jgi:hypothetical protein